RQVEREPLASLSEAGQPRRSGGGLLAQLRIMLLRPAERAQGVAHGLALRPLGIAGLARDALRLGGVGGAAVRLALDAAQRLAQLDQAVALAQPLAGRGRRADGAAEAVPAPQAAVARDQS